MQASASGSQPGQQEVRRVAVVGTGVIGASWAAYFLARGLEVSATDPMPDAQAKLRAAVARHWPKTGWQRKSRRSLSPASRDGNTATNLRPR